MNTTLPSWRILVVEDNLGDICLLRLALKEAGLNCELTVLHDGEEGLNFVRREGKYAGVCRPDMAVIDQVLPKFTGVDVLDAIRRSDDLARIPVAILTSLEAHHYHRKSYSPDIDFHITKPLNLQEYLNIGVLLRDILAVNQSVRTCKSAGM